MSHLLAVPGAVAGLLVPWTPHEPCGCSVRLPAAPLEQRQCRQLKTGVRTDPEGGEPWRQRGLGSGRAGAGHRGCGELAVPQAPAASGPAFPSWSQTAERPLPTQTIPFQCAASARAAEGPPTGCSSGSWLSQMSSFSYSLLHFQQPTGATV